MHWCVSTFLFPKLLVPFSVSFRYPSSGSSCTATINHEKYIIIKQPSEVIFQQPPILQNVSTSKKIVCIFLLVFVLTSAWFGRAGKRFLMWKKKQKKGGSSWENLLSQVSTTDYVPYVPKENHIFHFFLSFFFFLTFFPSFFPIVGNQLIPRSTPPSLKLFPHETSLPTRHRHT